MVGTGVWVNLDESFEDAGPTRNGRAIDFALGCGVACTSRQQQKTCSDHDCVAYAISLKGTLRGRAGWQKRTVLRQEPGTKEARDEEREANNQAFAAAWTQEEEAWKAHLEIGDVERAWAALSMKADKSCWIPNKGSTRR